MDVLSPERAGDLLGGCEKHSYSKVSSRTITGKRGYEGNGKNKKKRGDVRNMYFVISEEICNKQGDKLSTCFQMSPPPHMIVGLRGGEMTAL